MAILLLISSEFLGSTVCSSAAFISIINVLFSARNAQATLPLRHSCTILPPPPLRRGVAGSVVNPLSERMMGLLEECARRRAGGRPAADDADGRILQPSSPRCRRRQDPLYCERRWLIFPIARCCNCFLLPLMTDAAWHCSEKCTKLHLHSAIARDDSGHIRGLRHERPPGPQLGFGTRSGQAPILVLPRPS